ncbi:MAG: hypothetical protein AB1584_09370 [Pseudomonadota bacterium]
MNQHSISKPAFRRKTLTALLLPLLAAAGGAASLSAAEPTVADATGAAVAHHAGTRPVYSVINLGPATGVIAHLNEKGQAAFSSFFLGTANFFDGERVRTLNVPGGNAEIEGLNSRGVVIGQARFRVGEETTYRPFAWTVAGGLRYLPGPGGGVAFGINDRNQIVGAIPMQGVRFRAVRWEADGTIRPLGPRPPVSSWGIDINNAALAGGAFDNGEFVLATLWDRLGRQLTLGALGGTTAHTLFVNEKGESAGDWLDSRVMTSGAFYRGVRGPAVRIGDGQVVGIADLNDRGEIAGLARRPASEGFGDAAYLWSRSRGVVLLPRGDAPQSYVFDLNNRTEMVGAVGTTIFGDPPVNRRAVLWRGVTAPIDLNSLVYRRPPGLVLELGLAINDAGTILAISNAGLVLLRPGKVGTDAPVLGPVNALPETVVVGQEVQPYLGFIDNSRHQAYTAAAEWSDGCVSPHPLVRASGGAGEVRLQHRFCAPGAHTLTLRVSDSGGRTTETLKEVFVNAPGLAAISGRGTLASGSGGGGASKQPLQFKLWVPLGGQAGNATAGADGARATVALHGPFQFRSADIATASRSGQQVRIEGVGDFNGRPGYRFSIDAIDGAGASPAAADSMRVRISHNDDNGKEVLDYDSAPAAKAGSAAVGAGYAVVTEGAIALSN